MQIHDGFHYEPSQQHRQWIARDDLNVMGWRYSPKVVFESGQGLIVTDVDGRTYMDGTSGMMSLPLGHSHPEITRTIQDQAASLVHHSSWYSNGRIIELAERLCSTLPREFGKVNFAVTGSEANEVALRIARAATGGTEFVSALRGLHGGTLGVETLTNIGGPRKRKLGPLLTPTRGLFIHFPFAYRPLPGLDPNSNDWIDRHLRQTRDLIELASSDQIAAVILETIPIAGGMIIPPREWFHGIRELADEIGALLILDEAQLAPARTGTMWCFEQMGITPDIVTFAKGMGGGLPMCGAIVQTRIAESVAGLAGIPWAGTFTGDPLAAAAALTQLDVIERDELGVRAAQLGEYLSDALKHIQSNSSIVGDVRGCGLYQMLDFVLDKESREPNPIAANRVRAAALEQGLLLIVSRNYLRVCPPLISTELEIDQLVDRLAEAIRLVEKETQRQDERDLPSWTGL